jgi:WhiB family transcriptional regulator, redox-sensing transcriptional regulator
VRVSLFDDPKGRAIFEADWPASGACLKAEFDMCEPENKTAALMLCRECPVRVECLTHAVTVGERVGVWGGTTARDRRVYGRDLIRQR